MVRFFTLLLIFSITLLPTTYATHFTEILCDVASKNQISKISAGQLPSYWERYSQILESMKKASSGQELLVFQDELDEIATQEARQINEQVTSTGEGYRVLPMLKGHYGESGGVAVKTGLKNVTYLDDPAPFKITFNSGKAYRGDGSLITGSNIIYVMDQEGNFYAMAESGTRNFKHSSFFGGKPVAAAGHIDILSDGRILKIDNNSGHYAPSKAFLEQAADSLRKNHFMVVDENDLNLMDSLDQDNIPYVVMELFQGKGDVITPEMRPRLENLGWDALLKGPNE